MDADFVVGLDPQGEAFGLGVAHGVGFVALHTLGYAVEEGVHPGLAGAEAGEGEGVVGVGIAEVGVLAAEPAVLAGKGDDVVAVDALHFGFVDIVEVQTADGGVETFAACFAPAGGFLRELGDAGLVGVGADIAFGHTACHPHGAFLLVSFAGDFEEPYLVGVGQREGLAAVGIAVSGHEVGHHADGFAAVAGTLQGQVDKVAVVDALEVAFAEGCDAAPGGLAHGKLVLVDEAHHAVGASGLWDVDLVLQAAVVVEAEHLAGLVGAAGVETQLAVARVAVGDIGDHGAAIGGAASREQEIGAGMALPSPCGNECRNEKESLCIHDVINV